MRRFAMICILLLLCAGLNACASAYNKNIGAKKHEITAYPCDFRRYLVLFVYSFLALTQNLTKKLKNVAQEATVLLRAKKRRAEKLSDQLSVINQLL